MSLLQVADELTKSPRAALGGALLALGGAVLVRLAVLLTRRVVPPQERLRVRWNVLHGLGLIALAFAGASLLGMALMALDREASTLLVGQTATAFGLGVAALAAVLLARALQPDGLAALGLRAGANLRSTGAGLAAYVLCAPTMVGTMIAWPWLYERLGGAWTQQEIVTRIGSLAPLSAALLTLLAVALQPLFEEVLFRSFVQPVLVQRLGAAGGVVVTSVLFAAMHGGSAFLPIFGLSILLGCLMLRTQRLAAVASVHALHNGVMLLMVFLTPELAGAQGGPTAPGLLLLSGLHP